MPNRIASRPETQAALINSLSKNESPENMISVVVKTNKETNQRQDVMELNRSTVFGTTLLENETDYFSGQRQQMASSLSMSNKISRFNPKGGLQGRQRIEDVIANRNLNVFSSDLTSKEQLDASLRSVATMEKRISKGKFTDFAERLEN